jgi:tetratricopeptide (TPR) repeat protein
MPAAERTWVVLAVSACLGLACASGGSLAERVEKETNQRQAVARYNVGVNHLAEGRTALALRELRVALSKSPDDPWIHLALAEGYRRKANAAKSEEHLREALLVNPTFHQARLSLSALQVQMGRYEEAVVISQELVDDPTFEAPWRAHTNLGWALFKLGRISEARRNLQLALEYRSNYWTAALDLGILEAGEGRKLEAVELFQRVLEIEPNALALAEVNYRLGEIYVSLGKRDKALAHLSQAVATRPNGNWGKRSEDYLKLLQ